MDNQLPRNPVPAQNNVSQQVPSQNLYKKLFFTLVIVILIIGVSIGAYLLGKAGTFIEKDNNEAITVTSTPVIAVTITPTPESVVPSSWKSYSDSDYLVSFKYPETWQDPKIEINKKGEGILIDLDYKSLVFENKQDGSWKSIELSNFNTYQDNSNLKTKVEKLKTIYSSKVVDPKEWFWLPPSNAAVIATSKAQYIENNDSSFRGVYYYGYIGQGEVEPTSTVRKMFDLVMVLTDGKAKIFQINIRTSYNNLSAKNFQDLSDCNLDTGRTICSVDKELVDNLSIYKNIVSSIIGK